VCVLPTTYLYIVGRHYAVCRLGIGGREMITLVQLILSFVYEVRLTWCSLLILIHDPGILNAESSALLALLVANVHTQTSTEPRA
jgi:hypothetical protein